MVTVGARKREGFARKEKFGRVLDTLADFVMHSAFMVSRISGRNSDLDGDVLLCYDIKGHPDRREATVAKFMHYAISLSQEVSNADRIVEWRLKVRKKIFSILLEVIDLFLVIRVYQVAVVGHG
jgi:hypothetical protein